ncbi:MAG: hypothetical protein JSV31_31650 [Desulfobacterales bacterium]|nr:MAG: hypothetical protein JSV31_31650 [Desulfobacterales bacterium]
MSRPLRIQYPGAYYHVMNRGNRREDIFINETDRSRIDYGWLLNTYFGEDSAQGRRRYRAYVNQGIEGEIENPFEEVVHQSILGSQRFVKWVKKKLPRQQQREIPSLGKLQRH